MAIQRCYYCNELLDDKDLVIKPIPLHTKSGIRNYKRKFHINCLSKFLDENNNIRYKEQENSEWDKVYEYFKIDILKLDAGKNLSQHAVKRLLGLRVGQYAPNRRNTRTVKKGYSFPVILYTLKYCKAAIDKAQQKVNFKNEKHEIDYIMVIVQNNINFIQKQVERAEKARAKAEKIAREERMNTRGAEYRKKGTGRKKVELV